MASSEPLPKRRRLPGGQRQRVAAIQARETDTELHQEIASALGEELIERWAWGKASPQDVQLLASLALKDLVASGGAPPKTLVFLASLGGNGKYAQHMHKQLLDFCNKQVLLSPPSHCYLPYVDQQKPIFQSMILPHVLFADLFEKYKATWESEILPDPLQLKQFWKLQEKHPSYTGHAISKRKDAEFCVPFLLHGDGTPVTGIGKIWSKQLTIFSITSILGAGGSTKESLFHVWSGFDKVCDSETWNAFFKELSWSFQALWSGVWPKADSSGTPYPQGSEAAFKSGKPLAGRYYGCLWGLVGDLDYMSAILQLPHYSRKDGNCAICKCTGDSSSSSWKDCRPNALWTTLTWKRSESLALFWQVLVEFWCFQVLISKWENVVFWH